MNFAITAQIKNIKVKYLLLLLFLTMLCMIILGLKLGFISLAWTEIVEILLIKAGILPATDISSDLVDVVWMLRMPRIILAACVGMGLTLSGIIMQAVVKILWLTHIFWAYRREHHWERPALYFWAWELSSVRRLSEFVHLLEHSPFPCS